LDPKNSQKLFEQMRGNIISDMDELIDYHYEDINCSELGTLYENFVGDVKGRGYFKVLD